MYWNLSVSDEVLVPPSPPPPFQKMQRSIQKYDMRPIKNFDIAISTFRKLCSFKHSIFGVMEAQAPWWRPSALLLGLVSLALLTIPHRFSTGLRSGQLAGQSSTVIPLSANQNQTRVCFGQAWNVSLCVYWIYRWFEFYLLNKVRGKMNFFTIFILEMHLKCSL